MRATAAILAGLIGSERVAPCAIYLIDDPWLDMLLVPLQTRPIGVEPNRPDRC